MAMLEQDWRELEADFELDLETYMAEWEKSLRDHLGDARNFYDPDQPRDDSGEWTSGGSSAGGAKIPHEKVAAVAEHFRALHESAGYQGFDYGQLKTSVESARALSRPQLETVASAIHAPVATAKTKEDVLRAIGNHIAAENVRGERTGLNELPPRPDGFKVPAMPELPPVEGPKLTVPKASAKPPASSPAAALASKPVPAELHGHVAKLNAISDHVEHLSYDEIDAQVENVTAGLTVPELKQVAGAIGGTVSEGKRADLVRGVKTTLKSRKMATQRTGLR